LKIVHHGENETTIVSEGGQLFRLLHGHRHRLLDEYVLSGIEVAAGYGVMSLWRCSDGYGINLVQPRDVGRRLRGGKQRQALSARCHLCATWLMIDQPD
jgi:hypothetical protein